MDTLIVLALFILNISGCLGVNFTEGDENFLEMPFSRRTVEKEEQWEYFNAYNRFKAFRSKNCQQDYPNQLGNFSDLGIAWRVQWGNEESHTGKWCQGFVRVPAGRYLNYGKGCADNPNNDTYASGDTWLDSVRTSEYHGGQCVNGSYVALSWKGREWRICGSDYNKWNSTDFFYIEPQDNDYTLRIFYIHRTISGLEPWGLNEKWGIAWNATYPPFHSHFKFRFWVTDDAPGIIREFTNYYDDDYYYLRPIPYARSQPLEPRLKLRGYNEEDFNFPEDDDGF